MSYETWKNPPPHITEAVVNDSICYAEQVRQKDARTFDYCAGIIKTHLVFYSSAVEAAEGIIKNYTLNYHTRMLIIGISGMIDKNTP